MNDEMSFTESVGTITPSIMAIKEFIDRQNRYKEAADVDNWRFVGYVLQIGYDKTTIITNDTYKIKVGGIPRGSFLILVPANFENIKPHFTLIRVADVSPTPLEPKNQQTYFEMQKKSMPELDVFTLSELQWGALECDVLGMFYENPRERGKIAFSGDVNNIVSPHRYEVYAPDEELLNIIVNGTVRPENIAEIGTLRTMECEFEADLQKSSYIPVKISARDFMGTRTAMFGKTRLGKSNTVKRIAQNIMDATESTRNVGQIIFDINGEYANDNDQDTISLKTANNDRCVVYALKQRGNTPSKLLKLNFYENAAVCKDIIKNLLERDGQTANYVNIFTSVELLTPDEMLAIDPQKFSEKTHAIREMQIYWAILYEAGFAADENRLASLPYMNLGCRTRFFDPHFDSNVRNTVYNSVGKGRTPGNITTLADMTQELKLFAKQLQENRGDQMAAFGKDNVFSHDEKDLLNFLSPEKGTGPKILAKYKEFHDKNADNFIKDILKELDDGQTVILDLGNAEDSLRTYFSDMLSKEIFKFQEERFVNNALGDKYIQLYFEEAHNLFPPDVKDNHDIYSRFAKEGAKFHIGMIYSTQSPSTISRELLNQTENFFIGHLSSIDEAHALTRTQIAFSGVEKDILNSKTAGFARMLTMSNRFVIPVQVHKFDPVEGTDDN